MKGIKKISVFISIILVSSVFSGCSFFSNTQNGEVVIRKQDKTLSAGTAHTVGLKSDGTVIAAGGNVSGECDVTGWGDIVAVSAGGFFTVGLKKDGTVVAAGFNNAGQCNVTGWREIAAVSAGLAQTIGLKSDGTVVAVGNNNFGQCNIAGWRDIVAISAGQLNTVGLKKDGTVVAVGCNDNGQCEVADWKDIVMISAGLTETVGLKSDGTVITTNKDREIVSRWTDIVEVSAGPGIIAGLKKNGTIVAANASDSDDRANVKGWQGIVAISVGQFNIVGLKKDGTVVASGLNNNGSSNVSGWSDIAIEVDDAISQHEVLQADTVDETEYDTNKQESETDSASIPSGSYIMTPGNALSSLMSNFNLKAYSKIDPSSVPQITIDGESFYVFSMTYFNEDGNEGDEEYIVNQLTGNIYLYSSSGDMTLLYLANRSAQ
jgi:alpha-tubulin suppressor-like RCC1 family protein